MNKVSTEHLKEILADNMAVTLRSLDKICNIESVLSFVINGNEGDGLKNEGFEVTFDNKDSKRKCKSVDTLLNYLKKEKIVINDESEIINISDRWNSYEEYSEHKKFSEINMGQLLIRYKNADMFSLTGRYNDGYSQEHPHGIFGIDNETAEKALEKVRKWSLNILKNQYDRFTEEERNNLPDFDSLIFEIQKESDDYFALVESGKIPEGQSPFLCDIIHIGKTKYKEPQMIWHFYHELYNYHMHYKNAIREMQKNTKFRKLDYIFENSYYKPLKECLVNTEVTFTWHCTTSGCLAVVYYFKLNETSVNWLSKLKDDYDMKELDDLAFYKNGNVIFSSCTHEHFHNGD